MGGVREHPRRWVAAADRVAFLGCVVVVLVLAGAAFSREVLPDDLAVYRGAVDAWLTGGDLYGFARANGDAFTYPPATALTLAWVHLLPVNGLATAWVLGSGLLLGWCAIALHRSAGIGPGVAYAVLLGSAAGRSNLAFGQFSVVIFALCLLDATVCPTRRRGWLTGIAAALKLTPLVFLPGLTAAGRWRPLRRALLAAGVVTALGVMILPTATLHYLRTGVWGVSTVSNWDSPGNQSLRAVLARSGAPAGWISLGLSLTILVGVLAWLNRHRAVVDDLTLWVILGLLSILISPVSWTHHRFWLCVPILMPKLWTTPARQLLRLVLLIAVLLPGLDAGRGWGFPITNLGFLTTATLLICLLVTDQSSHQLEPPGGKQVAGSGKLR